MDEEQIKKEAVAFAKKNKNRIARELTDLQKYPPTDAPSSFFMAGSPGAGKTEHSVNFVNLLTKGANNMLRIDADEIRKYMPEYTGNNSYLFQGAVSLIVEKIQDFALRNNQPFVLDGTFSNYDKAVSNIQRSLDKNRPVYIFYIYQDPKIAWDFTQVREQKEGRHIPKSAFIQQFIKSRETIQKIRDVFDERVSISLVKKDFTNSVAEQNITIAPGDKLENHLNLIYTADNLESLL